MRCAGIYGRERASAAGPRAVGAPPGRAGIVRRERKKNPPAAHVRIPEDLGGKGARHVACEPREDSFTIDPGPGPLSWPDVSAPDRAAAAPQSSPRSCSRQLGDVAGVVLQLVSTVHEPIKQLDIGQIIIIERIIRQILRDLDAEERTE